MVRVAEVGLDVGCTADVISMRMAQRARQVYRQLILSWNRRAWSSSEFQTRIALSPRLWHGLIELTGQVAARRRLTVREARDVEEAVEMLKEIGEIDAGP